MNAKDNDKTDVVRTLFRIKLDRYDHGLMTGVWKKLDEQWPDYFSRPRERKPYHTSKIIFSTTSATVIEDEDLDKIHDAIDQFVSTRFPEIIKLIPSDEPLTFGLDTGLWTRNHWAPDTVMGIRELRLAPDTLRLLADHNIHYTASFYEWRPIPPWHVRLWHRIPFVPPLR